MRILLTFISLFIIILLNSCEKSDNVTKTRRLKELILDYSGDQNDNKKVFKYENDKLVLINNYNKDLSGGWKEYSKDTITYSGENITCTDFTLIEGEYQKNVKVDYTIINRKIKEELCSRYQDNAWVEYWRTKYQYEGSNITQWIFYLDVIFDGTLYAYGKSDFSYDEGRIQTVVHSINNSGAWHIEQKDSFSFTGNQLTALTCYHEMMPNYWQEFYRDDFVYVSSTLSESHRTYLNSINPGTSNTYVFDEMGYCISVIDNDNFTFTYQYEDGNGNAEYFFYAPEDFYTGAPRLKLVGMGFPQITPFELNLGPR